MAISVLISFSTDRAIFDRLVRNLNNTPAYPGGGEAPAITSRATLDMLGVEAVELCMLL